MATPPSGFAAPSQPDRLAIGITEPNANFVWPASGKPLAAPVARWRDALQRMAPHRYRLVINWPALQPSPDRPPDLDRGADGCMRGLAPCAGYGGVREQLRALAAAQRERPGRWRTLVVISGTPDWAAEPPSGCERPGTQPLSRAVRADAVPAYRELIAAVLAAAVQAGARLDHFSAWNEPNHPYFLSPQRGRCRPRAPTRAVEPYVRLVRALRAELDAAPGAQRIALGELAGYVDRGAHRTGVAEFIAALPHDVACAGTVWSQHGYVEDRAPVEVTAALRALDGHGCERPHEVWVTETGVGAPRLGADPPRGTARECAAMRRRLERWEAMPRVTAAFQYLLREDPLYPTGLVSADLSRAYRVLDLWTAWAGEREAADPAPAPVC